MLVTSQDRRLLQDLAASLGSGLDLGFMAHISGYEEAHRPATLHRFLSLVCPAAAALAPRPLALHWADSREVLRLLGEEGRMVLPAGCCAAGSNVEWWARLGRLTYGGDSGVNQGRQHGGVAPVMRCVPCACMHMPGGSWER